MRAARAPSPSSSPAAVRVRTGVLVALALVAAGCRGEPESARVATPRPSAEATGPARSVVLVTLDTTRADRLGCYGYAGAETPNIDALARAGTLFERVWAPAPITLPSHATILTGLPPAAHGVHNNGTYELPAAAETVAEVLQENGFATAAFVSAFVLDRRFGLDQGFDVYGDDLTDGYAPLSDLEVRSRPAAATVDAAIAWLDEHDEGRFFLWLHLFDPHQPYRLRGDLEARFRERPYDGEIAYADRELGRLIAHLGTLGMRDDTAVVVTADHGESLGEHGEDTHGLFVYDSTLRVPLVVSDPARVARGRRVATAVGLVDVAPTILDLVGVAAPAAMSARSVLAGDDEDPILIESVLPAESYGLSPLAGVVVAPYKYVAAPQPEVYALDADPDESDNLWDRSSDLSRRLARTLKAELAAIEPLAGAGRELSGQERKALESLGYVFDGERRGGAEADDPKAMAAFVGRVKEAASLIAGRRFDAARPLLEALVAEHPSSYDPLWMLAEVERKAGNLGRAEALFERARVVRPEKGQALIGLGKIARVRGHGAEARRYFEAATHDPESDDAYLNLAVAWVDAGDPLRAIAILEEARRIFPYNPKVRYSLALLYAGAGRVADARAAAEEAVRLHPGFRPAEQLLSELDGATGAPLQR